MTTGRRPKPAHLKLVQGNPGKRKINTGEPHADALKGPPEYFSSHQIALWNELVEAAPHHVLKQSDRFLLELAVRLLEQVRAGQNVSRALMSELRQCLAAMGMEPSARGRLSVAPPAPANPFAEL
jgi:hypothetical protein